MMGLFDNDGDIDTHAEINKKNDTKGKRSVEKGTTSKNSGQSKQLKSSPRKNKKAKITIFEFLDLDAILRKHNHGKNRIDRAKLMDSIFEWAVES